MTFPTLTGIGHPPFGGAVERPATPEVELEVADQGTAEDQAAAVAPQPAAPARQAPRRAARRAAAPAPAAASAPETPVLTTTQAAAKPVASDAPTVSEAPILSEVPLVGETPAPAPRRLTIVATQPEMTDDDTRPGVVASIESIEPTEAMARAFLGAVEARQRLQTVTRSGFEGRALEAARHDVETATAILEGALRARAGSDRWPQEIGAHLAALSWFASLALTDAQPDVAGAGRAVQALVATIEQLLASNVAPQSRARAA
jgi:hypothetical protein